MTANFDEIRCYHDHEVPAALERLSKEKQFMKVLSTVYPLMPKETLKQRLSTFKTKYEFQEKMVYPFLQYINANLTKGIELKGLENIDTSKPYLYISNHRDIILDSALLCYNLINNKMDTVEIAIGDNLLVFPWIEDLVRVNKSFIVKRGLSARSVLESSQRLSHYIAYTLHSKQQSIWLAQREGRAKDANDLTQESLLKMLNMYGTNGIAKNLAALNICPLTISYEYDPCDYLKAKEFQQKLNNADFKKSPQDDLLHMETGVMGYKGKVIYTMNGNITEELLAMENEFSNKNELVEAIAKRIDYHIHSGFTIYNINKIAFDLLDGSGRFEKEYTLIEKLDFEAYIAKQILKIDLEDKDEDFLTQKMLEMYSNPLINKLKTVEK
ncbi:MAG: acyltransferase [Porphyromonadaceae bacterium CG2_30_38_12]|nr:MAG: acyltransferase [Porphyromonadaceae bacterium CG2_30_38_12]